MSLAERRSCCQRNGWWRLVRHHSLIAVSAPARRFFAVVCRTTSLVPAALSPASARGCKQDLSGLQAILPVPLLRSRTPVEPTCPRHIGHLGAKAQEGSPEDL